MQNNDNITIEGWMVNELALEGQMLLLYATLYRYSKSSPVIWPTANLAQWLGISERSCQRHLMTLEHKGYLMIDRTDKQQPRLRALRQMSIFGDNSGGNDDNSGATDDNSGGNGDKNAPSWRQNVKEERTKEENIIQRISSINQNKIDTQKEEKMDDDFLKNIIAYAGSIGQSEEVAEAFYHYNEARGWRINGEMIYNWQAVFNRWAQTYRAATPIPRSANRSPTNTSSADADYLARKHQREREEAMADEAQRRANAEERASPECQAAMAKFFAKFQ